MGRLVAAAALVGLLALGGAGCTSEDDGGDQPSPAAVQRAVEAVEADDDAGAAQTLPALVEEASRWSGSLPPEVAADVLAALAAHPDALRAAFGPTEEGRSAPAADLDAGAVRGALTAAGADAEAAADFRRSYLDYLRSELTRSLVDADPEVASWPDVLVQADAVWLDPSAEVIGALEAGCSGDDCFQRTDDAMAEAQAAVDAATYVALPDGLVPESMRAGGDRVPMASWTTAMTDDWVRLQDTTPLPEIADRIEGAYTRAMQGTDA